MECSVPKRCFSHFSESKGGSAALQAMPPTGPSCLFDVGVINMQSPFFFYRQLLFSFKGSFALIPLFGTYGRAA